MLLIAIVDDERSDSSALKALVDTYFQQNRQAYMIHVFNGALDFIRSTENHDIVFMDIRMDKLDGLEVARIMRKINTDSVLIFVTHMAQLAIKGYEVDALDFIVKPADQGSINVEVFDHNLVYHTTKGNYDIRGRLSDVMKRLDPKRFIMCNRSYVVNLRYVSNINNDFLVVDGTQISISKSHRKEILQHFSNFLGENL